MSEAPAISAGNPGGIGPGRLVLVAGPSGAGKDTLLGLAKIACAGECGIVFPRRVVTREASLSEDNEYLSEDAFREALACGEFAIHWEAHGHRYALPRAINEDIRAARTVVVNVSRKAIDEVRRRYANVVVVLVTAPPQVLVERLAMRARSSDGQIDGRLHRAVGDIRPDVTILNVGRADDHARRLLRVVRGEGLQALERDHVDRGDR
jgi:ribose 1,5-bisphosphokinase